MVCIPVTIRRFLIGSAQLENDAVGSQHLANNAVSYPAQIKDGIIGYAELTTGLQGSLGVPGPDSIGTTELKEPSVGSSQLYEPAVGSQNIYDGAVYGPKIASNAVGYGKLTTGLQGSLIISRLSPYAGDDSEMSITGQTPGTIKTATVLKNSYVNPVVSLRVAAQLKADVGTYAMRVQLGTDHVLEFTGTDTVYQIHVGSVDVSGEPDSALALQFMLVNSRVAGVSSNKLVDIYTVTA